MYVREEKGSLKFCQILFKDQKKDAEFVFDLYTLLFVSSGKATMKVNDMTYQLREHSCLIVPPHTPVYLSLLEERAPLSYYQMSFHLENLQPDLFWGEYASGHSIKMLEGLVRLLKISTDEEPGLLREVEEQMIFFELMYFICKEREKDTKQKDTKGRIQESIRYIETHYHDELTRESLAKIAGFSPGYYSHAFKKVAGSSPIDYLNEVRMKKAKEMLATSGQRLKTIAKSVGLKDEFYFSRLFKKSTGSSPTEFVKKSRTRILNVENCFLGHFKALNVTPFATLSYECEHGYQLRVTSDPLKTETKSSIETMLHSLIEIKPDVILCSDFDKGKVEMLQRIAPTVVIPWMQMDWREHFMQIGDLLGRSMETKKWLDIYDDKAEKASDLVKGKVNIADKVMIIRVYNGRLRVYGKRNIGNIFYNDLKLRPVDIVEEISPAENQYPITFAQVAAYKPDHLFIMASSDAESQDLLRSIMKNREWFTIPAVEKKQVHFISRSWLDYSPISHLEHLEEAVELLRM